MKKRLLSIALVFLMAITIFAGCTNGFTPLSGGPAKTDAVSSNGKMAVQKGNYLYYTNGYVKVENISGSDNKFGSADFGAIYRAELDEDGNFVKDNDGNVKTEILVPKIVGTENASFFIFDDKIYYATPNVEKNSSGEVDFKLTDFYVSNLDGSKVERLYKTEVSSTNYEFAFYKIDEKVVLAVYDSSSLYIVDCASKEATKIAENVENVVLPTEYEISSTTNVALKNVYYTRTAGDDDEVSQGNILAYTNLTEKEEKELDKNATFAVFDIKENYLIYTKKTTNSVAACYYYSKFANGSIKAEAAVQLSYQAFDNTPIVLSFEDGNYRGMVVKNASGYLVHVEPVQGDVPSFENLTTQSLTLLTVYGDDVYAYNSNNELYKLNYKSKSLVKLCSKDDATLDFSAANNIDFDGKYVYVYQTLTGDNDKSGTYLSRINTLAEDFEIEVVGNVLTEHIKYKSKILEFDPISFFMVF